jgi:hypothetical protein
MPSRRPLTDILKRVFINPRVMAIVLRKQRQVIAKRNPTRRLSFNLAPSPIRDPSDADTHDSYSDSYSEPDYDLRRQTRLSGPSLSRTTLSGTRKIVGRPNHMVEDMNSNNDNEPSLRSKNITSKVNYYMEMLEALSIDIGNMKRRSVIRYDTLNKINFMTHVSIIVTSSFSAYIQTVVPEDTQDGFWDMVILGITSYSGLILAMMKFYKLEEKKENSHNLRDRLADLEGKTCHIIDMIKPWNSREHYCAENNGNKGKDKLTEWTALVDKVDGEYLTIIEQKRELFSNYDKLFDSLNAARGVEDKFMKSFFLKRRKRDTHEPRETRETYRDSFRESI